MVRFGAVRIDLRGKPSCLVSHKSNFHQKMTKKQFSLTTKILGYWTYPNGTTVVQRYVPTDDDSQLKIPSSALQGDYNNSKNRRGNITMFSSASRSRMAWVVAETAVEFQSMFTATVPEELWAVPGAGFKAAMNKFQTALKRRQVDYLWFLEFTQKGVPHAHYLLTIAPDNTLYRGTLRTEQQARTGMARLWYNAILSGSGAVGSDELWRKFHFVHAERHVDGRQGEGRWAWERLRTADGAKRYALKYALKTYQKDVPVGFRVGRFYGYSRRVRDSIGTPKYSFANEQQIRAKYQFLEDFANVPKIIFRRERAGLGGVDSIGRQSPVGPATAEIGPD